MAHFNEQFFSFFGLAFHLRLPFWGSNPIYTIYAFSICIIEIVMRKTRK